MRPNKNHWEPTQEVADLIVAMRRDGATYGEIAKELGLDKNKLVRWYLETMGKTIGIRPGGYHSKENVHRRMGVYFDVTSLIEEGEE